MDLFHFQDEAAGAVFWHDRGWTLFRTLVDYMRRRQDEAGYLEVNTPELMDRSLWEASGHWDTFAEHMFTSRTADERLWAIKPMNCPGHVQVFKNANCAATGNCPCACPNSARCTDTNPRARCTA